MTKKITSMSRDARKDHAAEGNCPTCFRQGHVHSSNSGFELFSVFVKVRLTVQQKQI